VSPAARSGRLLALAGIASVSLGIRSAITAISPISEHITADVPISLSQFGIIGSIPLALFALASAMVPILLRFVGLETLTLYAVAIMTVGQILRALAGDFSTMLIGSLLTFVGVGASNVLLPPLVKRYFPDRIGAVTSLYAALLAISLMIPAAVSVPIADAAGWRTSLALWAILGAVPAVPWVLLVIRRARGDVERSDDATPARQGDFLRLWRAPTAWFLAGLLAITSLNAFVAFSWFPALLADLAGVDAMGAGLLLAVFSFIGLPLALVIPIMAARGASVGVLVAVGGTCFALGYAGLLLAPEFSPLLWVTIVALGPLIFPLCLVLTNLRSRTESGAVALSSFMQAVGYVLAAAWPAIIGVLHDTTRGWAIPILVLLATALVAVALGVFVSTPRYIEDELRAPD
jgi:CP family cyanate transporter-like MFS transporter